MFKKLSIATLGLAALVLNPSYACRLEKDFDYSAVEMRAAVEGTWTLTTSGGSYTFDIEQAAAAKRSSARSLVPSAHACGSRTLVKSASACESESVMPIEVHLAGETTDGVFEVYGATFVAGSLKVTVAGHLVYARVSPEGITSDVSDGATLVRASRH